MAPVVHSANLDAMLGAIAPSTIPAWLPPKAIDACRAIAQNRLSERVIVGEIPGLGLTEIHCFRSDDIVFCEFEAPSDDDDAAGRVSATLLAEDVERDMADARDIDSLSAIVTEAIATISGFERVLVYRFDTDGCGDVVGESLAPDWPQSFLGLRFPDTDIPAQARALYRQTADRWIPTRDYVPVPLVPAANDRDRPISLALSRYRSVSPIHRMYQGNIGVDGSMSISVMRDGELWGLIIGHHRKPHRVPVAIQHLIVALGRAFSLRLDSLLNYTAKVDQEREMQAFSAMLGKLAAADDFLMALTEGKPNIVDLLPGCVGAAVVWESDHEPLHLRALGVTCRGLPVALGGVVAGFGGRSWPYQLPNPKR
ncbi:Phytochrome two-component sensor histidine kinase [Paramagnetospirillum magnetotacticum MS-1]|uniref:Phytochrome two-component sensor histidine kinase n=1 Tax=Paramagnetospirillum magnetotacticum MS-1 TaxID=272627 RepID=A0A0C2UV62_PARME|nr:Phytochrome two-component sensor histidine kinase [Paramagnetospirillum magnetotacticum MS-1]